MSLEYVRVTYHTPRRVFIDGVDRGASGDILRVDTGRHLFHLGMPFDYDPSEIERIIKDTNPLAPALIAFRPRPVAPGMQSAEAGQSGEG